MWNHKVLRVWGKYVPWKLKYHFLLCLQYSLTLFTYSSSRKVHRSYCKWMGVTEKLLHWKGRIWCALSVLGHVCGAGRFSLLPCACIIAAAATDPGIAECGGSGGGWCNSKRPASQHEFVGAKYNAAATPCTAAASSRTELGRSVCVKTLQLFADS
jgi:hypothetical protein